MPEPRLDVLSPQAKPGSVFGFEEKEKKAWKNWSPSIWLGTEGQARATSRTITSDNPGPDDKAEFYHHKGDAALGKNTMRGKTLHKQQSAVLSITEILKGHTFALMVSRRISAPASWEPTA